MAGRFTKAKAEKAGWAFFHDSPAETVVTDDGTQHTPASVKAEKFVRIVGRPPQITTEEAESMRLLLERIHAYEVHLENVPGYLGPA
jgi:hypothetical protein